MVKVANDMLLNMNGQRVTPLVLLDVSAAFDTVDHAILSGSRRICREAAGVFCLRGLHLIALICVLVSHKAAVSARFLLWFTPPSSLR